MMLPFEARGRARSALTTLFRGQSTQTRMSAFHKLNSKFSILNYLDDTDK